MSVQLEHDYIGLSELSSMESSEESKISGLNLKATELRLGLPGSFSSDRDGENMSGYQIGVLKSLVSGAKRGFSDASNGDSGKWAFCDGNSGGGSVVDLSEGGCCVSAAKDGVPPSPKSLHEKKPHISAHVAKAQVVGWPPVRSFRKNSMASHHSPKGDDEDAEGEMGSGCLYVKVSMDGAPYLRKVDLKTCGCYMELTSALEKMFRCFTIGQCGSHRVPKQDGLIESRVLNILRGSEYVLTYEDKDGDWMQVGDVPWEMFRDSCKRLRIMKSIDAIGLAPGTTETSKNHN